MAHQTATNRSANHKLVQMYVRAGVTTCELRFENCTNDNFLGFAHRHKRRYYRSWPEGLSDFNQTILTCTRCHEKIEYDAELSEEKFNELRGPEDDD